MRVFIVTSVVAVLGLATALSAHAYELRIPCSMKVDKSGLGIVRASELQTESTDITLQENEEVVFAELNFQDELAPGTEVEIWPAVAGETPPWELVGDDFPYARNLWITDERTGAFIRFEVTDIARAWQAGNLANLGFVIRVTSQTGEASQQSLSMLLSLAKDVALTYHVLPVRSPKVAMEGDESDPRKVPYSHDGSGREE